MAVSGKLVPRGSGITARTLRTAHIDCSTFGKKEREALLDQIAGGFDSDAAPATAQDAYDESKDGRPRRRYMGKSGFGFEEQFGAKMECRAFDLLAEAGCTSSPIPELGSNAPKQWIFGWRRIVQARGFIEDTPEDFAARILDGLRCARILRRDNRHDQAEQQIYELGVLDTMMAMKFRWEASALRGENQAKRLAEIRAQKNQERHNERASQWRRWQAEAERIWRGQPSLTKNAVASHVKNNLKLPDAVGTIAGRIKKPPKAG